MHIIVICYKCGHYLIAKSDQKTRTCPSCSTRLKLIKTKKVVQLKSAHEASNYIRELKKRTAEKK
jgi:DNA-directed RNA polymerase subunit RPC12/RpoP